jgi:DNA-binding Xre family transcriptional regulator
MINSLELVKDLYKKIEANKTNLIKREPDDVSLFNIEGKTLELWISQKKLIFPWEINWYQLKDREYLTLKRGLLKKLIELGAKKAGNLNKLKKILKVSELMVYYGAKGKTETITVKNLRKLLSYLEIPYDKLNSKIVEIKKGKKASIKNPKFPINLLIPDTGFIIGAIVSDGCLYIDKGARMARRIQYSTDNIESVNVFVNSIKKIFGNVLFLQFVRKNCIFLRIGTSIVCDALVKVGAAVGNKSQLDVEIPWIIRDGNLEMKKAYLKAVFTDEGSVGRVHAPYIVLSRYKHLDKLLTREHIDILDKYIEPKMKIRQISGEYVGKEINFGEVKEILSKLDTCFSKQLLHILTNKGVPKLLLEESNLLKEFNIENKIFINSLTKTKKGHYSIKSSLLIQRKRDIINFYEKINFLTKEKQEKLEKYLKECGWL